MAYIEYSQGDTYPDLEDTILDPHTGAPMNLTDMTVLCTLTLRGAIEPTINAAATLREAISGTVYYTPTEEDTATVGTYLLQWKVAIDEDSVFSFPKTPREVVVKADLAPAPDVTP